MHEVAQMQPQQVHNPKFDVRAKSNMYLMLVGKLVSLFGTNIYNFAISLYVLKMTGSGLSFANTMIFGFLPRIILGPFAGAIADRFDRKKMVVSMDLFSGLVVLGLWGVSQANGLQLPYIYITAVLLSICNTFFGVALTASIPNIVDDKRLMKTNSLNQGVQSLTQITAPMLGGIVYGFINIHLFLLINGISFIVSAISELFINFQLTIDPEEESSKESSSPQLNFQEIFADMKEGFHYLRGKDIIYNLALYSLFINFFFNLGLAVPLPYIVNNVLKMPATQFGIIEAAIPVGILVASLTTSVLPQFKSKSRSILTGIFCTTLLLATTGLPALPQLRVLGNQFAFIFFIINGFCLGFVNIFINVPIMIMFQTETDNKYRGRVLSLIQTMATGIMPLGFFLSGLLTELLPAYSLPMVTGFCSFILFFKMLKNPTLRDF